MKKFLIISVNLILILGLFFTIEYMSAYDVLSHLSKEFIRVLFFRPYYQLPVSTFHKYYKYIENSDYTKNYDNQEFFPYQYFRSTISNKDMKKLPVLLFGCSYTYGLYLEENETFSAKLQKYSNRTIINRGIPSKSIMDMLYMLRNNIDVSISRIVDKKPEYIIYTYIEDHMRRLYQNCGFLDFLFTGYKIDKKTQEFKEKNDLDYWWWHSYILRKYYIKKYGFPKNESDGRNLLLLYIKACNKEIKKYFPESKFVIFVYDDTSSDIKAIEDKIKEEGIEIIYLSDLSNLNFATDPEYKDESNHPTAKAWDVIVPLLAEKLKL